jgi:hypothetical protein
MKTLIGSVFVCLGISSAYAGLPLYEPFNYPVGADLAGQSPNGIDAWAATGTGGAGGTDIIGIASGSLTAPGLPASLGNSIAYGGLGLTDRIALGTSISTGTVYYSFLFSVTDLGTLNATGGFLAGFNTATGTQTNQPGTVGARLLTRLSGSGYNIGIEKNSGTAANFIFDNTVRNVGDTVFVVGSYTFNTGSSTDDGCALWINPDPSTFGLASAPAPTLTGMVVGNDLSPTIVSFLFRQGNASAVPGNVVADELRVDTTWAGVTVPEPSAIALLAIAGGGWLLRRRRGAPLSR